MEWKMTSENLEIQNFTVVFSSSVSLICSRVISFVYSEKTRQRFFFKVVFIFLRYAFSFSLKLPRSRANYFAVNESAPFFYFQTTGILLGITLWQGFWYWINSILDKRARITPLGLVRVQVSLLFMQYNSPDQKILNAHSIFSRQKDMEIPTLLFVRITQPCCSELALHN